MNKLIISVLTVFITCPSLASQTNYKDSLIEKISTTRNDSLRAHMMNELSFYLIFNDIELAKTYIQKGIRETQKTKNYYIYSQLLLTKGIYFDVQGKKDSAEYYFNEGLHMSQKRKFRNIEMMSRNNLGLFYWGKSSFDAALEQFFKALKINKQFFPENKESTANYENNIGLIYQELHQYDKAIQYHQRALATRKNLGLTNGQAISQANLGVCFKGKKNYKKAEDHFVRALDFAESANNQRLFYSLHGNLGNLYAEIGRDDDALLWLSKTFERPENIGVDPKSELIACINMANLYNKKGIPEKAHTFIERGEKIIEQHAGFYNFSSDLYLAKAQNRFLIGDYEGGQKSMTKYKEVTDSIFSKKNADALAESAHMNEILENKLTIASQKKRIAEQTLKVQQFRLWSVIGGTSVFALILFSYLFYKRHSNRIKKIQLELNLSLQKEIVRSQRERLHISRELHDHLGSYLTLMSATTDQFPDQNTNGSLLESLKDTLNKSMKELRRTVWLINQDSANLDEIAIRMRDFFAPINKSRSLVVITVDPKSEDIVLSDIQTTHLFRIIQEGLNNALKHSACTEIHIELHVNAMNEVCFSIQDNGRGFDVNKQESGHGQGNMNTRITELGGSLSVHSELGFGTLIKGCFPLKKETE
jgi:signal transduction histidine kinase/Tfp pilus assembly protein PilF